MSADEQQIAADLARGHSAAIRKLYTLHYAMVRYFVLNNSGSEDDARDLFQEAMVVLFEQARNGKLPQNSSLKTWLYAICRNKWMKQLEKRGRSVRLTDFEDADDSMVVEEPNQSDLHRKIRESMGRLGVGCRKILLLFYYFHKTMDEIATELNYTNADNAKSQKYKCIQKLKTIYAERNAND